MSKNWKVVKEELDNALDKIRLEPPREVRRMMQGIIESGAGSYDQYYSTIVFASGEIRALGIYSARFLLHSVDIPGITLDQLKRLARMCLPVGAEFLGYCGLKTLMSLTHDVCDCLDSLDDSTAFRELIASYFTYVNRLHLWVHFYFPWEIGVLFPHKKPEDIQALLQLATQ